ncbi:MAG: energy transducer TonB [candidate division Zixibacteria bacterium]|nr:energy transducer TonB [candidate division Zixibacteria bacterium]
MTITPAHRQWSPIGAIELKSSYRRNMTKATLVVVLLFAASLGGIALGKLLSPKEEVLIVRETRSTIDAADLGLPPAIVEKTIQVTVSLEKTAPVFAIPEPVPDADVVDDYVVMAPEDYASLSPSSTIDPGAVGGFTVVSSAYSDTFPEEEGDYFYDEVPIIISLPTPKYPEMARKAGIEGKVYVEVLIDTRGKVRDARIIRDSGANAGFEEAAIEAAWKGEWRPAMQNKQPVAVRVSYPVVFKLK